MVGTMSKTAPGAPDRGGKNNDRKQKEDASDFQPKNPAHAAERPQESTDSSGYVPRRLPGGSASCGCIHTAGARFGGLCARGRVCTGSHLLACNAPGYPQSNP